MKRIHYLYLFFLLCGSLVYAQDTLGEEIEQAYVLEKYDEVISKYAQDIEGYSSKALYYVGMAYYMKEDDPNCLKFMDLALKEDENNADAYFIKGKVTTYSEKFNEAIPLIQKAIQLDSTNTHYYSALGDVYSSIQDYGKAMDAYQTSVKRENPSERAFAMIPQIYAKTNQPEKALEAFYQSKDNVTRDSQSYITALYNIGLYEFLNQNYDKAESAYLELLEVTPLDYHAISKLIQVYYGKKEYDKAAPLKKKMYDAQKEGLMEGYLRDMFCFDQFRWNDQLVQVFERYEEGDGELYYKHLFYLLDENNNIQLKIQSENSPFAIQMDEAKYVLGTDYEGTHYNWGIWFQEDFEYEDMKKAVIYVLDNKAEKLLTKK